MFGFEGGFPSAGFNAHGRCRRRLLDASQRKVRIGKRSWRVIRARRPCMGNASTVPMRWCEPPLVQASAQTSPALRKAPWPKSRNMATRKHRELAREELNEAVPGTLSKGSQ